MTSESEKLKACPFCGAPGNVEQYEEGWIVGCSRKAVGLTLACPLFPSFAWTNEKAEAIAAWNRRSPEGYDVAPLEWERVNDYRHYAKCVIGYYDVRDSLVSPGQWFFELNDRSADPLLFPTLDEAKAAAEADYRQRILSALRPRQGTAPAVGGEPVWRLRHFCATSGPCSANGDGCTCSDAELSSRYLGATAQCCMCGKKGLSTTEGDGGTECQLEDGRWTCSWECWERAVDPPPIPAPTQGETVEGLDMPVGVPTADEKLCFDRGMSQWEASTKRSDLTERDRVGGALAAYMRQAYAIAALRSSEGRGPGWQIVPAHVTAGDYAYDGWDIGHVTKRSGQVRAVVEDENGRLFIHRPEQVAAAPVKSSVTG